jgi:hypothetical protein
LPRKTDASRPADWVEIAEADLAMVRLRTSPGFHEAVSVHLSAMPSPRNLRRHARRTRSHGRGWASCC